MTTRYSMEVCDAETDKYTSVALFSDIVPTDVLHDLCVALFENTKGASTVLVVDMDTSKVVAEAAEPDDDPDWGYNENYGYDPYMGCYTDDC